MSRILATGQFTILNMINQYNLTGFITSNLPQTQTIQNNTYSPSWSVSNLILTAELYKSGQANNLCVTNENIVAIRWYYKKTTDTTFQLINNNTNFEVTNHILKVKNNILDLNNPNILFKCEVDYRQSENLPIFTYKMDTTFTLAQQGVSGQDAYAIILTRENTIFESDALGNDIVYANNDTEIKVLRGSDDITNGCVLTLKTAYNCTGEKVSGTNNKFRILTVESGKSSGYLEIEIKYGGIVIGNKRFSFSLSKRGLPGAPGAKGKQFNLKGQWVAGTAYKNNYQDGTDVIEYNGSRFYCLQEHTSNDSNKPDGNIPPVSNSYWGVLSARGSSGYDSTSYWLINNVPIIKEQKSNGVYSPTKIQLQAKKQVGQGNVENYTGLFKVYYSVDYVAWTEYTINPNTGYNIEFNIPNINFKYLKVQLYSIDGSILLDEQTIPVVQEDSSAITVVLTNENVTIASDDSGTVSDTQLPKLTTNVLVYRGSELMQPNGANKWIRKRYSKTGASSTVPTKADLIEGNKIEDTIINDANVTSSQNLGDNYVGYIYTYVWCNSDVSFTTNIYYDDTYAIYINDVLQSSGTGWKSSHPVTLTFKKGINKIECLWGEGAGGDGFGFNTALSNQTTYIARMNCYGDKGYELSIQNQTPDIGSAINNTKDGIKPPTTVSANLNNNDNGTVELLISTFDGINLNKKFTWTKMKAGKPAAYVMVTGQQTFKYAANSTIANPSTITLTATTYNIGSSKTYAWYYNNGSGWNVISGATSATYTVNPTGTEWTGKTSVSYKCIVTEGIYNYSDEITVVKLYDTPSYSTILTNETHTIACDSSGNVITGELDKAYTNVLAFYGTQQLTAVSGTPTSGQFSINITTTNCTAVVDSTDKSKVKITSVSADTGNVNISINLENKITVSKLFTWSKTKAGKKGTSYRFRGAWLSTESYVNNEDYVDTVSYNGSLYACVQSNNNKQPDINTSYWTLVAQKGDKGQDGQDANLLDWVQDWDTNKTQIKDWQVITPRLFAGTNSGTAQEPMITGVAIGKNVLGTADETIGIVGYNGNNVTFKMETDGSATFGSVPGRQLIVKQDGSIIVPKIKTNEIVISDDEDVTYMQLKSVQNTLLYLDDFDAHYWNFDFDLYSHRGIGPTITQSDLIPTLVNEGYYAKAVELINSSSNPLLKYENLSSGTNFSLYFKIKFTKQWYKQTSNLGQAKLLMKLGNLALKEDTGNNNEIGYMYFDYNGTKYYFPFAYEINRWYTFGLIKNNNSLFLSIYDNATNNFVLNTDIFGQSLVLTRDTTEVNPLFNYNGTTTPYVSINNFITYNLNTDLTYTEQTNLLIKDQMVYNIPTTIDTNFSFTTMEWYGNFETYIDELVFYQNKALTQEEMKSLLILDEIFIATKRYTDVPEPINVTLTFVD